MSLDLPPHSNDVEEELRRVRLALDTVYAATNSNRSNNDNVADIKDDNAWFQQRQLSDRYLTSFQKTAIAWMVCDKLLMEAAADPASSTTTMMHSTILIQQKRFFAAQTLHKKCRTDVHELPPEALPSLRDSLLTHFQASVSSSSSSAQNNNNVALTTRLAMTLAALSVQMGWMTVVTDLMGAYRNAGQDKRKLLLFFLRALPEECASDRLYLVEENHRYNMRDQLIANSLLVFDFLQEAMPHDAHRVWEVLHLWIRYVPVRPEVIAQSPLLPQTVQMLQQADATFLESACDVVVEVLRMYPSHYPGNQDLVNRMIPLLSQLPLEQALQSSDEDIQRAYCRVVTEMGESYLSWILSPSWEQARQLVAWILQCASRIQDTDIASITLHFWYRFVSDIEMIEPYEWRQELVDGYSSQLLDLISVCAQHLMKYPEEALSPDRLDDWHKHRFYVSETIEDSCRLLGGHSVITRMNELLRAAVQAWATDRRQWQGIESCLACLCALHLFIPNDESEVLPAVFEMVPQLPADIPPLRATASRTVGKYASWLAAHAQYLQPLLPFLAHGLAIPECSASAAVAIKELCAFSHPSSSFDIAEPVLQLFQQVSQSGQMEVEDELEILEGVCMALSRKVQDNFRGPPGSNTSPAGATAFLESLVTPIGQRLTTNLADGAGSARRTVVDIDRLTVIVQHLHLPTQGESHPIVVMLQSVWSILDQTSRKYASDFHVAEKICRLYKHSLRSCDKRFYQPLLHPLMHQLMQSYQVSRQSPYLYAASICLTEYGSEEAQQQPLYNMVASLAETTFGFVRNLNDCSNHPDVMEEFFYLMERMVSYCPDPLMSSPLLPTLLQCSAMSMQVDHPGVNKGTLKFLDSSLSHVLSSRERSGMDAPRTIAEQVLQSEGRSLVLNLVRALMGDLPCYAPYIPDILWYATRLCPVLEWLTAFLESSSTTTVGQTTLWPSGRTRSDLMGAFTANLSQDEFRLALRSFEAICARERRFRRST